MPLPHFTNITTADSNYEPLFVNLFEVDILIPNALTKLHPDSKRLLLENATKVSFPTYPTLETKEQRFKYSTRRFLGVPQNTSTDVTIDFNLNQNDAKQAFVFRMIKDWYDLGWNNEEWHV